MIKGKNPFLKGQKLSRYIFMPILMTIMLGLLFTQCKKDDYEGEVTGICPLVILTDPVNEAVSVALGKIITVTFNEDMDAATINTSSFILMEGTNPISGTVSPVNGNKAAFTFTPASPLKPSTLYTATIKKGVRDPMRNALQKDYVWSFTTIGQHTVALSSSPALGGSTTGAGSYLTDASATIKAVATEGYTFTNWTEGTKIFTLKTDTIFKITEDRTLVANFTANPIEYTVALSSNPLLGGTTSGAGLFTSGASVTVKAVPASGYTFTNWTEGTNIVSTNANYMLNVTGNRTLVANFTSIVGSNGPIIPNFGGAGIYSILTKSGISSTGITSVQGNIGVSPAAAAAITGFGLIMDTNGQSSHTTIATHVTGSVFAADYAQPTPSNLTVAISNMETAYTTANNLTTPAPIVNQGAGNISGLTLAPGLYKWSTGVKIDPNATVTLSGGPNDTWVFQIAQDLTLDPSAQVKLIGGAQAKNIIWVVAGQAVLNTNTVLYGNIFSKTLISLNTGSKVTGGLFAQTAVTLNTATVIKP